MEPLPLSKAFTLIEPGPVVLVATRDGERDNVMTITWTMVMDFSPRFAITTGPWNYSWTALRNNGECVLAIPGADMIDTAVAIGMCSGGDTDKFERFGLERLSARQVKAPLIGQCLANVECRVVEIIEPHGIVVLDGVAAWHDPARQEKRMLHAIGDGTFIADGERFDRRDMMRAKIPPGV
ncbi:MAG TPA: flavin reductase family protein [Sphingomonadaceae bacterium]|nr:flavin reductase family protein [Sphingomonadaceae bacterium]